MNNNFLSKYIENTKGKIFISFESSSNFTEKESITINNLLDSYSMELTTYDKLLENIRLIRTIFNSKYEISLELYLYDNLTKRTTILKMINQEVYELTMQIFGADEITYIYGDEIPKENKMLKTIINELNNSTSYKLKLNEQELAGYYKLFYNEVPDFSDENINIKIQVMMLLIVSLLEKEYANKFNLATYKGIVMPININLIKLTKNMRKFGMVDVDENKFLNELSKNKIKELGNIIRETNANKSEELDFLVHYSNIFYAQLFGINKLEAIYSHKQYEDFKTLDINDYLKKNKSKK